MTWRSNETDIRFVKSLHRIINFKLLQWHERSTILSPSWRITDRCRRHCQAYQVQANDWRSYQRHQRYQDHHIGLNSSLCHNLHCLCRLCTTYLLRGRRSPIRVWSEGKNISFLCSDRRRALYSPLVYASTYFIRIFFCRSLQYPWQEFIRQELIQNPSHCENFPCASFRGLFRWFLAFSKLNSVFWASKSVLKSIGLMIMITWVGSSAIPTFVLATQPFHE